MAKIDKIKIEDPQTLKEANELYLRVKRGILKKEGANRTITNLVQKLQTIKKTS